MRILLVSDYYPPFLGGAHRQVQLLARALTESGYEVSVATVWQGGMADVQREDFGADVYRLKQLRTVLSKSINPAVEQHQPPFPDPITVYGLRRLINRLKPDVVHSYGWITASCAVAMVGKKIPLIVSSRDYGYSCATRELLYEGAICSGPGATKCFRCSQEYFGPVKGLAAYLSIYWGRPLLLSKVSGIHSVSDFVQQINRRDWIGRRSFLRATEGGRIIESVMPGFLVDVPGSDDEEILHRLPAEPYILFVGGLQPRKGIIPLLKAYEQLQNPPPLVLIGYVGPNLSIDLPPNVTILENVPHHQVMTAWKHALFGVTPSLWADPSPGVTKEAMSQGKAVVGTSVGGITEMIEDGKTGLLVPPGDINALVVALQRLIEDRELRERLGQNAQQYVQQHRVEAAIPRFESMYRQLARQN